MSRGGQTHPEAADTIKKSYFSTDDVPLKQQFDAFRGQVGPSYDLSATAPTAGGHQFEQHTYAFGRLTLSRHRKREGSLAFRQAQSIRRDHNDSIVIVCLLSGTSLVDTDDADHHLGPGMVWFRDMSRPARAFSEDNCIVNLTMPRQVMKGLVGDPRLLHARTIQSGIGQLFADHLISLARNLESMPSYSAAAAVEITELLLAAALGPTRDKVRDAARSIDELLRERASRHIERHLRSPELTPASIAAALGVSRRKLYQVFERSGGVVREIQARRLGRAREALVNSHRSSRVKEVAFAFGFESEAHFSLSFKRLFGFSPSEAVDLVLEQADIMPGNSSGGGSCGDVLPAIKSRERRRLMR